MAAKKRYVRFQIEDIKYWAAHELGLNGNDQGARALYSLIRPYCTYEDIEAEAGKLRAKAERAGLI